MPLPAVRRQVVHTSVSVMLLKVLGLVSVTTCSTTRLQLNGREMCLDGALTKEKVKEKEKEREKEKEKEREKEKEKTEFDCQTMKTKLLRILLVLMK